MAVAVVGVLLLGVVVLRHRVDETGTPMMPPTTLPPGFETVPPGSDVDPSSPSDPGDTALPTAPRGTVVEESCAAGVLDLRACDLRMREGVNAGGRRLPVVILLHGFSSSEDEVRWAGGWDDALLEHDFLLATPVGVMGSWNAGVCCGIAHATGVDDVGYLNGLIDRLVGRPDVDPERITMVGFSNGGLMVWRYLCASAGRLHAAVSVGGTRTVDCTPNAAVPVLQVHGTADRTVPYEGGQSVLAAILGVTFAPVEATLEGIASEMGCGQPSDGDEGSVRRRRWAGCGGDAAVELWSLNGWGHDWMFTPLDLTDEILAWAGIG